MLMIFLDYKSPAKIASTSRTLSAKRPVSNTSKTSVFNYKSEDANVLVGGQTIQ